MVMEAHELGFRLVPFDRYSRETIIIAIVDPKVSLDVGLAWAAGWLGTAYDFTGLLGMFWVVLGRVLKRRFHNPTQNSRAMFCSEMGVVVLQRSHYPGAEKLIAADTSPQDLLDFLRGEGA
jgi:hypothetical protein